MSAMAGTMRMRSSPVMRIILVRMTLPENRNATFRGHALRPEALENHLVSPAFRALPLRVRADRRGQQRPAKHIACNPRARGGQVAHLIGDEMRPGAWRVQQKCERAFLLGGQFAPFGVVVAALRHDTACERWSKRAQRHD